MENFIDVIGYEGLYQISNLGNVKSLGNNKLRKEKILKKFLYLRLGEDTDLQDLVAPLENNTPPEENPIEEKNKYLAGTL